MKNTPGPWNTRGTAGHDRHGQSAVYAESGKDIAIVYDGAANANLIAAAPDLLAALKRAAQACEDHNNGKSLDYDWIGEADRAIARAEGGAA